MSGQSNWKNWERSKKGNAVKETWFYGLDVWIWLDSCSNKSCTKIRWWKYFILLKARVPNINFLKHSLFSNAYCQPMQLSAQIPPGEVLVTDHEKCFGWGLRELKVCYLNLIVLPLCTRIKGKVDSDYVAGNSIFPRICPFVSGPLSPPLI